MALLLFLPLLLRLSPLTSALPSGPLILPRASTCSAAGLQSCAASLPSNFCCPSGSTCQALAGGTTAVCCPSGSSCDKIQPVTCDVSAQDPQNDLTVPIKTSVFNVPLAKCGSGTCCPFGYSCDGGDACLKDADQSVAPSAGQGGSSSGSGSGSASSTAPSRSATSAAPHASSPAPPAQSSKTKSPSASHTADAAGHSTTAAPADEASSPASPPTPDSPPPQPPSSSGPAALPAPPSLPTSAAGSLSLEASPSPSIIPQPASTSPPSSSSLSPSAAHPAPASSAANGKKISIIGGIIGASAIVLLICIITFLCIRRHRRSPYEPPSPPNAHKPSTSSTATSTSTSTSTTASPSLPPLSSSPLPPAALGEKHPHPRKESISDPIAQANSSFRTDFILKRQRSLSLRASLFRKPSKNNTTNAHKIPHPHPPPPPPVPTLPSLKRLSLISAQKNRSDPNNSTSNSNNKRLSNSSNHTKSFSHDDAIPSTKLFPITTSTSTTTNNNNNNNNNKPHPKISSRLSIPNPFDTSPSQLSHSSPTPPSAASPADDTLIHHGSVAKATLRPIRAMKVSSSRAVPQLVNHHRSSSSPGGAASGSGSGTPPFRTTPPFLVNREPGPGTTPPFPINREPSSDTINVFADPGVVAWGTGRAGWRGTHGTTFTDLMDEADLGDVRRGKPYVPRDA